MYVAFCLICHACSLRFSSGSILIYLCMCRVSVSCMHHVAVLNAAFCVVRSLLMFGEDARGDLRPKTHIQHTHSQHLSTSTQATTNDKSTHSNMMW